MNVPHLLNSTLRPGKDSYTTSTDLRASMDQCITQPNHLMSHNASTYAVSIEHCTVDRGFTVQSLPPFNTTLSSHNGIPFDPENNPAWSEMQHPVLHWHHTCFLKRNIWCKIQTFNTAGECSNTNPQWRNIHKETCSICGHKIMPIQQGKKLLQ